MEPGNKTNKTWGGFTIRNRRSASFREVVMHGGPILEDSSFGDTTVVAIADTPSQDHLTEFALFPRNDKHAKA
jgi:hypothetical protein